MNLGKFGISTGATAPALGRARLVDIRELLKVEQPALRKVYSCRNKYSRYLKTLKSIGKRRISIRTVLFFFASATAPAFGRARLVRLAILV